jgi:hypothetical protein
MCRNLGFSLLFSVAQTTDKTRNAVQGLGARVLRRCTVSESVNWRKYELECMRLAADCMQLVGNVDSPALQSHFLRMARVWSDRAVRGPSADTHKN